MKTGQLNIEAHELSRQLFDLQYKLRTLSTLAYSVGYDDKDIVAFGEAVEAITLAQVKLHETQVVIDATRDPKDQSFSFSVLSE